MKKSSSLGAALVFLVAMGLAAFQGQRVERLRDAESFYRWIQTASNQYRLFGNLVPDPTVADPEKTKDQEFYNHLIAKTEDLLPPIDTQAAEEGAALPRLVRYFIAPVLGQGEAIDQDEVVAMNTPEMRQRLARIWDVVRSDAMKEERAMYAGYVREKVLWTRGTQLGLKDIYPESGGTMVSLGNMFFGFRKMAANLVWIQADKYWDEGQFYRMIPLMKMTVMLDPEFIDAYLIGAWHLSYNATAGMDNTPEPMKVWDDRYEARVGEREGLIHEGILFLKDGIRKNATNYKLYFDLGYAVYEEKLEDHKNAIKYLKEATRHQHDRWVPRTLYRIQQLDGQYQEAIEGWRAYLEKFPDNPVGPRFILQCQGRMLEQEADEAARQAAAIRAESAEMDPQAAAPKIEEANALEAKSNELYDQAVDIWTEMAKPTETTVADPYAIGRLARIQAARLLQEGRVGEAIAGLEIARFSGDVMFKELSDYIIDIKREYGRALSVTEARQVIRERQAESVANQTIAGREFQYRDDGWYQIEYRDQGVTELSAGSSQLAELRQVEPDLDQIISFGEKHREDYSDVADMMKLATAIVFEVDGSWYRYTSA